MANLDEFGGKDLVFDDSVAFDKPVPAGDYTAMIDASEVKLTKNGDKYLSLTWKIADGPCRGRVVFEALNLWYGLGRSSDDNEKDRRTRGMASNALVTIAKSIGMTKTPRDSSELHNKPCTITIKTREANGQYAATSEVKAHRALGSTPVAVTHATPQAAYVPATTPVMDVDNSPWAREFAPQ